MCKKNPKFFDVKAGGTYSNRCVLEGYLVPTFNIPYFEVLKWKGDEILLSRLLRVLGGLRDRVLGSNYVGVLRVFS